MLTTLNKTITHYWSVWTAPLHEVSHPRQSERIHSISGLFLVLLVGSLPLLLFHDTASRFVSWTTDIRSYVLLMGIFLLLSYVIARLGYPDHAIRFSVVVNTVVMFGATVAIGGQFGLELMYFMVL
ncbi:MAG: hypothetical protein JXN59_14200, partial [Anaerolineae bacterium]|nr:hypothetical protein [Anaerolineae bacterium]